MGASLLATVAAATRSHDVARKRAPAGFAGVIELLDAGTIRSAAGDAVSAVEVLATTPSTNEILLARSRAGHPIHRLALLAEQQTAGRGRRGRNWASPPGGNLYLSFGWRCESGIPDGFSLVVGIAVAHALSEHCGIGVRLKWPNDIQVEGRKLGGILVEVAGEFGGPLDAVIGIGLNIELPPEAAQAVGQPWTDLRTVCGEGIARNRLAGAVIAQLATQLERLQRDSFSEFRPQWNALDALRGLDVTVSGPSAPIRGTAAGVDASGALQVIADGMLHTVSAGDVSVRTTP